jgi:hypothetical protein
MRSRVAAVTLLAVPFVALPYVRAKDDAGGGFAYETVTRQYCDFDRSHRDR